MNDHYHWAERPALIIGLAIIVSLVEFTAVVRLFGAASLGGVA